MDAEKGQKQITNYMSAIKIFFKVTVILILFFVVGGQIFLPDERDQMSMDCQIFETEWQQVLASGERVPAEVPGTVDAKWGEVVTLVTTLPEDVYKGQYICFRTIWQDVDIYVDGELRQSYTTKDSRPFGTNSAMRYIFLELREEDAGKELQYAFSSNSKYAGNMRVSYIGDRASIWMQYAKESGVRTVISVFLFLMSLFCVVVCLILEYVYKKKLALNYLAWTIFFSALWVLSEIEFRQIIFPNVSVISSCTYWSLMVIPITMILYINEVQEGKYQKVYIIPATYSSLILVICTLLQIFDIRQFVEMLIYTHIGIAMTIISIITTITIDIIKKKWDYLAVGIGIYGLLFTAVLEILVYYVDPGLTLGTILALGLLFLLMMAIIKTGQDLFQSEKKKQQAILAKEAQAKFLANMSHEIRTPINAVIGMNEMIMRESKNETVLEYASNIQSASDMLLGLVNDILDFTKIESEKLELVEDTYSLAKLLQDEMLLLNTRANGKPIATHIDVDENIPSQLVGDELRIKQILTNILSNAVKYTKEGSVTLKVFFEWNTKEDIQLGFSVIDTGEGIRKEDLPKIFDSFKRLDLNKNRNIQGTGLGLNIAKQLVDLMNGTIGVESEYGKGSTFTVTIPQKVVDKQPIGDFEAKMRDRKKNVSQKTFTAPEAKVLVVDDNGMNRTLMKHLLERTKIQVDLAPGGQECLEMTKENKYDVIFMDHMMPEMDGVETLNRLRADVANVNKHSIVVALTANAVAGCREMYLGYGFDDYFSKPILADKLEELLIELLPKDLVQLEGIVHEKGTVNANDRQKEQADTSQALEETDDFLEVDREIGISYCMDSEEFYQEVLGEFCKVVEEYLPKLESSFQNKDWQQYALLTHSLKGNARNIGAMNFSELSLQHELAAKEGNDEYVTANYEFYIEVLKKLEQAIKKN